MLPRERKVLEKEKEMRASLSRVKPIGVNCKRLGWVGFSFHLRLEGDAVYKDHPGEARQKQNTWPGDGERPFKVSLGQQTLDKHTDRKYGFNS